MEAIEIQVWQPKEAANRYSELSSGWFNFWINEPLNASIVGDLLDEGKRELLGEMLKDQMAQYNMAPTVVAWDKVNGKVAGFVVSAIECAEAPGDIDDNQTVKSFEYYATDTTQKRQMKALESFLGQTFAKGDLFNKFSIDKLLYIMITSVCPEYTRRGLANTMTERVLQVAEQEACPFVASVSTSSYTQRNKIKRFQFQSVFEINFENNYQNYASMPEAAKASHDKACVLVKRIV